MEDKNRRRDEERTELGMRGLRQKRVRRWGTDDAEEGERMKMEKKRE